ncbi:MAG: DMT family transporter [Gemmatimonadaceae bacterium]|nr:DMT family transporter [Gemmatimonadaceae bacterium]
MQSAARATWRASASVALAACGFGSISLVTNAVVVRGGTLDALMFWRYVIAIPGLALVAGYAALQLPRTQRLRLILGGGPLQAMVTLLSLTALQWITPGTLGFLFYTFPGWVAVIAVARGTERLTPRRIVALTIAFAGIVLMVGSPWGEAAPLPGVLFALGSAIVYAIFVHAVPHWQGSAHPAASAAYICVGAGVVFALLLVVRGEAVLPAPRTTLPASALLALVSTVAAFTLFFRGLTVLGPVRTAVVSTIEPFYTTLASALVLGTALRPVALVGGALIAAAVVLIHAGPREGALPT